MTETRSPRQAILGRAVCILAVWAGLFAACPGMTEITELPCLAQGAMFASLSSETAKVGDRVEVELREPINLRQERLFIPIKALIIGEVVEAQEAERGLQKASVKVQLHTVHYPNGAMIYVDGLLLADNFEENDSRWNFLRREPEEQLQGESSLTQKVLRIGKVGTATLTGGPIGAALATGSLFFDKGGKVRLEAGDPVKISIQSVNPNYTPTVSGQINSRQGGYYSQPPPQPTINNQPAYTGSPGQVYPSSSDYQNPLSAQPAQYYPQPLAPAQPAPLAPTQALPLNNFQSGY